MKITEHARQQLHKRLPDEAEDVIVKLTQMKSPGKDQGIIVKTSGQIVRCSDGSNGHYLVAIVRKMEGVDRVKTVLWSRDLDARRLNLTGFLQIN